MLPFLVCIANNPTGNLLSHRAATSTLICNLTPAGLELGLAHGRHMACQHATPNVESHHCGICLNTRSFLQSGLLQGPHTHHQGHSGSSSNFLPQAYREQQTSSNTGSGEEEQLKRLAARRTGAAMLSGAVACTRGAFMLVWGAMNSTVNDCLK